MVWTYRFVFSLGRGEGMHIMVHRPVKFLGITQEAKMGVICDERKNEGLRVAQFKNFMGTPFFFKSIALIWRRGWH